MTSHPHWLPSLSHSDRLFDPEVKQIKLAHSDSIDMKTSLFHPFGTEFQSSFFATNESEVFIAYKVSKTPFLLSE